MHFVNRFVKDFGHWHRFRIRHDWLIQTRDVHIHRPSKNDGHGTSFH